VKEMVNQRTLYEVDSLLQYYYPDGFIKKEVSKLTIRCQNHDKGCMWKGGLDDWQDHVQQQCDFGTTACPDCEQVVLRTEVSFLSWITHIPLLLVRGLARLNN
jgi:hypothetical protein